METKLKTNRHQPKLIPLVPKVWRRHCKDTLVYSLLNLDPLLLYLDDVRKGSDSMGSVTSSTTLDDVRKSSGSNGSVVPASGLPDENHVGRPAEPGIVSVAIT